MNTAHELPETETKKGSCPVRWVCLSDLHLGEEGSLLSCPRPGTCKVDPKGTSQTLEALIECLVGLFEVPEGTQKPTLILAGDVIDLATTPDHEAVEVFGRFLELVMGQHRLFGNIVYIPGNHDHHIWETAREDWWAEAILRDFEKDVEKWGSYRRSPTPSWHTTSPLCDEWEGFESKLLSVVARMAGADIPIRTYYPNFLLWQGDRCAFFTHGHYTESPYRLISRLDRWLFPDSEPPTTYRVLEHRNFAWVDFVWSALGQSGKPGEHMEEVWDQLQSDKGKGKLAELALELVSRQLGIPGFLRRFTDRRVSRALWKLAAELKPTRMATEGFEDREEEGLLWYMGEPFLRDTFEDFNRGFLPVDINLVIGHTHRPYVRRLNLSRVKAEPGAYPELMTALNTGGWVIDGHEPREDKGAAIVMLDSDLSAVSLRLYNESRKLDHHYQARPEKGTDPGSSVLSDWLEGRIHHLSDSFDRFSRAAAGDVHLRLAMRRAATEKEEQPRPITDAEYDLPWPEEYL